MVIEAFDPQSYGTVAELLVRPEPNELGPGKPDSQVAARIRSLKPADLFGTSDVSRQRFSLCLSGIWLLHDFLDESHVLSQDLTIASGSYWHGIMHRREPDYGNSKYWFRRVGNHAIFDDLLRDASKIAESHPMGTQAEFLLTQASWDPYRFVDLCERAYREKGDLDLLCRDVQLREWQLLFDYCYHSG